MNTIEGFNPETLTSILSNDNNEELPTVDSIVFDSILLSNGKKIKCIKNYYDVPGGIEIKKNKTNNCIVAQRNYDVNAQPFSCTLCHLQLLNKLKNKEVKIKYK
jgi:hypothetical protein